MQERELTQRIIEAAQETKAEEIVLFNMDSRSPFTDFVIICTGRSQAHVRGIADNIEAALKEVGQRALAQEGYQEGSWVLMDFNIAIVHIFHPETRAYYNLEELLQDYPREDIAEDGTARQVDPTPTRNTAAAQS